MSRDTQLFVAFVVLFAAVNVALVLNGTLAADWTGVGVMVAAGFTLSLYSFLYKDNPLFKFAEHVFVGVAAAYIFGQYWYQSLYGEIIASFTAAEAGPEAHSRWLLLIPTLLGLLMLTRFSKRIGWLSRYAFAFFVGVGAGFTIPRYISSFVLAQMGPSLAPITWSVEGLNLVIILIGVVSVLIYFFFSVEHTGAVGVVSKVGVWFLMVSFGASFGYTIMARLSLLIGRIGFLMRDWLGLQTPML
jgi:hypothetical protein